MLRVFRTFGQRSWVGWRDHPPPLGRSPAFAFGFCSPIAFRFDRRLVTVPGRPRFVSCLFFGLVHGMNEGSSASYVCLYVCTSYNKHLVATFIFFCWFHCSGMPVNGWGADAKSPPRGVGFVIVDCPVFLGGSCMCGSHQLSALLCPLSCGGRCTTKSLPS